jgi:hypothetical protein
LRRSWGAGSCNVGPNSKSSVIISRTCAMVRVDDEAGRESSSEMLVSTPEEDVFAATDVASKISWPNAAGSFSDGWLATA